MSVRWSSAFLVPGEAGRLYRAHGRPATFGETGARLRPLLPTRCRLLPIGQIMSRFAGTAPPAPRGLDRARIVAVEEVGTTGKELQIRRFQAVDEHDHRSAVRVLIAMSQPDRL